MKSPIHSELMWLWRENRPFAGYHVVGLICVIVSSAIVLGQPLVMKWLIDEVVPNKRWGALAIVSLSFLLAVAGRAFLSAVASLVTTVAVKRMAFGIRTRCVKRVLSFSAELHARYTVGDLLQRIEEDVTLISELGSEVIPSIVHVIVDTTLAMAVMIYLDWRLSVIVISLLPIFNYVRQRSGKILRRSAEAVREANGRLTTALQEFLVGAIQIQLLGAEQQIARRYTRLSSMTTRLEVKQRQSELLFTLCSMTVIGLGVALMVEYGGARVILGGLTIGGLVAFYGYISAVISPMNTAMGLSARLIRTGASIRRLVDIDQTRDRVCHLPGARPMQSSPRMLTLSNVSFRYGNDKHVLRGVQFHANAGERIAIVGVSGSGKSSLLKLIPRLYDATEGSVQIDGCDVRSIQPHSLRKMISFVLQEPMLFQGTLRENMLCGSPSATQQEIDHVAWISCLTDVLKRLPNGWETDLGPMGVGLSGGEKQRVAIARALLQQRPILILDEAASALDISTEHRLLSRLEAWTDHRIVIIVSHRSAASRWADRVIVLRNGMVVEVGSHESLSLSGTHYRTLWQQNDPDLAEPQFHT